MRIGTILFKQKFHKIKSKHRRRFTLFRITMFFFSMILLGFGGVTNVNSYFKQNLCSDRLLSTIAQGKSSTIAIELNTLISNYESKQTKFLPMKHLFNGDFYETIHTVGPKPLWERLSFSSNTVAGQTYKPNKSVVNYAELVSSEEGAILSLVGTGSCAPSIGSSKSKSKSKSKFDVAVTGASVNLGFNSKNIKTIPIPISGVGGLQVKYADDRCRVLTSYKATKANFGSWEKEGLTVVQVRTKETKLDGRRMGMGMGMGLGTVFGALAIGSMNPLLARAAEEAVEYAELPKPYIPIVFALVLLVGIGVLTGSLGDVIADEALLGDRSGARAKKESERSRRSFFKDSKGGREGN